MDMRISPPDLRRARAMSLLHEVLQIIDRSVDLDRDQRRQISMDLDILLQARGVELVDDHIREKAGLPARGPNGWTLEELIALEAGHLAALRAPVLQTVLRENVEVDAVGNLLLDPLRPVAP